METQKKPPDIRSVERQVKAIGGLIKLLSNKGFYGNLSIRFEAGHVVKCDNSSSLRLGDIEELLKT